MIKSQKIIIGLFIVVALVTSYISCTDGGDFDVYLQAARQLSIKQNIYVPPFVKGLQYYYSVFFALLLSPFAKYIFLTEFIWLIFSYYLLYRIKTLIGNYFTPLNLSKKQKRNWLVLSILMALQFIMYDVSMIQVTIFLLWAILESLQLIQKDEEIWAGILLATVINIKIMPVIMLPYLFYRGHFKALATCLLFFVVLLFLPAVFIGWNYNQLLLSEWWKIINPSNKEHMFETAIGTHSIVAWLPVYLTPTAGDGDIAYRRNIFNVDVATVNILINVVRLLFLAVSLLFLKSWLFKKENNPLKIFWEAAYFLLLIPLLLPHQQKYDFLLALPMIVYLLYFFITTFHLPKTTTYWLVFIFFIISVAFFSPLYGSDIIGRFLFRLTQYYRCLTFATIFLIPIALYCSPARQRALTTQLQFH